MTDPLPVIVFGDHTRIFKYIDFPFLAGADGTQILAPNLEKFDSLFLYYALIFQKIPSRGYNRHFAVLKQKKFPLPPLPEQRAIAHVLRTVQRAKEATEKVIAAARQLKQSLMGHLFTYGPVPFPEADQVELQETEVGEIPQDWNFTRLGSLLREPLKNGHSAKATNTDRGIRTLTLTAVTKNDFSIENTKLTIADPEKVRTMWLKAGDIFVERANTSELVGLAALFEGPENFAIYPDLMIRVRVQEELVLPKFLAEFLISPYCREYFKKNAKKTAGNFPKIDQGVVENTYVPLPSIDDQKKIVTCIRVIDRKLKGESVRYASLGVLFDSLLHHLMTGQLRVHDLDLPPAREAA